MNQSNFYPYFLFPFSFSSSTNTIADPGMTNTNTAICSVQIDMSLPENQNPQPSLEEDEFIESFTTPLVTLYAECKKLEAQGYAIDARVGTFAQGIELTKRMNL